MDVLDLYQSNINSSMDKDLVTNLYARHINSPAIYPIIALPRSIVDKLKYKGIDYKDIVARLPLLGANRMQILGDNEPLMIGEIDPNPLDLSKSLAGYIGMEDAISVYSLTKKLLSNVNGVNNRTIFSIINFELGESDYNREIVNLASAMSTECSEFNRFDIESDSNGFYIILNNNSFIDYDSMYNDLSRELCVRMLQTINESFVYRSVFFRSL